MRYIDQMTPAACGLSLSLSLAKYTFVYCILKSVSNLYDRLRQLLLNITQMEAENAPLLLPHAAESCGLMRICCAKNTNFHIIVLFLNKHVGGSSLSRLDFTHYHLRKSSISISIKFSWRSEKNRQIKDHQK